MKFCNPTFSVLLGLGVGSILTTDAMNFIIIQPDDLHFYEDWSPPAFLPWPKGYPGEEYPGTSTLPWINKLKDEGLYLTQAYTASPKCGTSRYSTITGRYASRSSEGRRKALKSGVTYPSDVSIANSKLLDTSDVADGFDCSNGNIAQVFRKNGYSTGMVGKWHLSNTDALGGTIEAVKAEIEACGFIDVEAMYPDNFQNFDDWAKKKTQIDHNMEYVAYKAVEFIEDNVNNDFFLFVNPTAPHAPDILTAMSKDCRITVDGNFTETMGHGWSVEGMTKEFGDDCFAYRENVKERAGQSTKPKDLGSIWVDDAVGAIYKALERTNQLEDTLILFQLDHGKIKKDQIWEGGVRIPQFLHYPKGLGTSPRTWDGMVSTIDIGPTFLDFAGIDETNPHRYAMDGISWKNAIENIDGSGDFWRANRCLFFESSFERSVRCGCDKYMLLSSSSTEAQEAVEGNWSGWGTGISEALTNLCDSSDNYIAADPSIFGPEATNIIASESERATELATLLQCHLLKTDANIAPVYKECTTGETLTLAPSLRGTTLQPNPSPPILLPPTSTPVADTNPDEDTTAPQVYELTPITGAYLVASPETFTVMASDDSSILTVMFQLQDPRGNKKSFVDGNLIEVNADGSEKWTSEMTLDMSGKWQWRARVRDNAPAKNTITTSWFDFYYLGGISPVAAAVDMIKADIQDLIIENPILRPKLLRLGFHDCVGGCDGCVDLTNPDNYGLDIPIDALTPIALKYAHNDQMTSKIGVPISRADIWALAALTAADMSSSDIVAFPLTHVGRVDCLDADPAGNGGADRELPGPDLTTHELVSFFKDTFNFTADETVVIMGAHSIGRVHRENSGFDTTHGWVNSPNSLNNGYFDVIVGGNRDPNDYWDLLFAPRWTQEVIENSDFDAPSRIQWFHQKDINNTRVGPDGQLEKIIMLNSDIALVRDLSNHMESIILDSGEIVHGSVSSCNFRCPLNTKDNGCPEQDPPLCPVAMETFDKAVEYKFDNELFLTDFEAAFDKMVKNGYDDISLVALSENYGEVNTI